MATTAEVLSREAEIDQVMRTTNLMRPEATALVARRHGEYVSDIVGPGGRPLTDEERRRLGLGRSILDVKRGDAADTDDERDSAVSVES